MTASEHNTDSDSLEHRIHPPLSAERDYRETPPMRNPLRDLRGIPEGTFRADLFYTQAIFRAENSPIPNKLVGRQFTGGNPHRSPPRCVRTSDAQTGTWFGPDSGRRSSSCLPPIRSGSQIAAGFGPSHLPRPLDAKETNIPGLRRYCGANR